MKILICSIVRDRLFSLPLWHRQINELIAANCKVQFHLSVAENNSTDGSKQFLRDAVWTGLHSYYYKLEDFPSPRYGSIKNEHRCELLAAQRNKAMLTPALQVVDKVLWIEPDIGYKFKEVSPLLYSEADVISGVTKQGACQHYDSWSCRRTPDDAEWFGPVPAQEIKLWTTWCQFCVLKAQPIREHLLSFSNKNPRTGHWDNDVCTIQEWFHLHKHHDVRLRGDIVVEHYTG